jgi:hypothetical protein
MDGNEGTISVHTKYEKQEVAIINSPIQARALPVKIRKIFYPYFAKTKTDRLACHCSPIILEHLEDFVEDNVPKGKSFHRTAGS